MAHDGALGPHLLMPEVFGGPNDPRNTVYVPVELPQSETISTTTLTFSAGLLLRPDRGMVAGKSDECRTTYIGRDGRALKGAHGEARGP